MLRILEELDKALEGFPQGSRICSAYVDPNPLLRFAEEVQRGVELCRQSLRYYEKPDPDMYWEEPELRDPDDAGRVIRAAKRHKPWLQHTYDFWMARRDRLVRLMVVNHDELFLEYEDTAAMRNENAGRKRYRPLDSIYVLQCHMLLAAMASPGAPKQHILVQQSQYLRQQGLLLYPGEPSDYPVSQQLGTLKWLMGRWKELMLHPDLELFLLQLELQSAHLLLYADTCLVHDLSDYRRSAGDRLWAPNDFFLGTVSCVSVGLHEDLFTSQCVPTAERGRWSIGEGMADALRRWFVNKANKMTVRTSSPWMRDNLLVASIWPGERDLFQVRSKGTPFSCFLLSLSPFQIENPREASPNAMQILKKFREDKKQQQDTGEAFVIKGRRAIQYSDIIRMGNTSPADVILENYDDERRKQKGLSPWKQGGEPEGLLLQLALAEVISQEAKKQWQIDFSAYCTLEIDFPLQIIAIQKEPQTPRLVQIFHHWQLVYKGQIYWMNSFLETLCAWFRIISHERAPPHTNPEDEDEEEDEGDEHRQRNLLPWHLGYHPSTSTEQVAVEMFSRVPWCRQRWWPQGPPGEGDLREMESAAKELVF